MRDLFLSSQALIGSEQRRDHTPSFLLSIHKLLDGPHIDDLHKLPSFISLNLYLPALLLQELDSFFRVPKTYLYDSLCRVYLGLVQEYEKKLQDIRDRLKDIEHSHVWPFQVSGKACFKTMFLCVLAFLIVYVSLYLIFLGLYIQGVWMVERQVLILVLLHIREALFCEHVLTTVLLMDQFQGHGCDNYYWTCFSIGWRQTRLLICYGNTSSVIYHDRISTRPFLSLIEKKWLAFQVLFLQQLSFHS